MSGVAPAGELGGVEASRVGGAVDAFFAAVGALGDLAADTF